MIKHSCFVTMWKLLLIIAILANIFSIVSSVKETETTIITTNTAAAASSGVVVEEGDKGTVAAGSAGAAAASSTTIIKTEHHGKKCAVNERYSKCPEKLCQPQVCEDLGVSQCSRHDDKSGPCPGPPACICIEGFVRNEEGVCIPAKECSSCGKDRNATVGCGVNCGQRCSNYKTPDVICADVCYPNSCDCKKGYVFDDYVGFCVLPKDCSNKNAPEPEGTESTPGNGNGDGDGEDGTDACDDCNENDCDDTNEEVEITTEMPCNEMNEGSTTESNMTTERSGMRSTTRKHRRTTKRPSRTTTDDGSDVTTEQSENGLTTEEMETEMTTRRTRRHRTTTKRPRTTTKRRRTTSTTRRPRRTRARRTTTEEPTDKQSSTTMMTTTAEPTCEEEAIPLFAVGSLRYTVKILYEMSLSHPGISVIVGGGSILYLMGQLALYAKGTAKKELLKLFNFQETEQISCAFPRISNALTMEYDDIEFSLFCKIYADTDCAMTDEFIQNTEQIFIMAPENLDFMAPDAAKTISDEVEKMTNGNFENYLRPATLSTLDHLIMVDAEGFQGKWEKQFNPSDTTLKDFYYNGRISKVQCMYQKDMFLYGESSALSAKILRMNYVGGDFGLVVFLPNGLTGLNDLLKKLQRANGNAAYQAVQSLTMQMVEVDLPKFEISVANRLKMPSEKAGVTRIFSNTSLGLENVATCEMPYVSEILQKITFHVDEYGMGDTKDVDFAPLSTTKAPRRQIYRFKADHPFVFALFHKEVMIQAGIFAGN